MDRPEEKNSMPQPNILIFMTDQQRGGTVLPGDPYKAQTPVLDRFREEATTFSQHYCPAPHCCPSRASFFTGMMPTEHGIWHNVNVGNSITRGLKSDVRLWSEDLQAAGYQLHFAGKWHVSNYEQPRDFGWQHIFPESMCHGEGKTLDEQDREACERELNYLKQYHVNAPSAERGPGEIQRVGQTPYVHYGSSDHPFLAQYFHAGDPEDPFKDKTVVNAALDRIETLNTSDPWCLYVGTLGPHDPYLPPQRFLDLYKDVEIELPESFDDPMLDKPGLYRRTRDRFSQLSREEHIEAIRHYLAFCSYEDWLFGQVLEKLKARGDYDNTIVLYLSDHGDYAADHGLWCKGLPSFLSAYHVPAMVKLPGGQQGVIRDEFVSLCDFGPTFLEAAGVESPTDFTGKSLLPLLQGERPSDWRDALFFQSNGNETYGIQRSILTDKWRFVYNGFDYDELYDLQADPQQMKNFATDPAYQAVVKELYTQIWKFGFEHKEHLVNDYIMTALADYGQGLALENS